MVKQWLNILINTTKLSVGLVVYFFCKKTPAFGYQGMVGLFCTTKGYSNDLLSSVISFFNPPVKSLNVNGTLGSMSEPGVRKSVVSDIEEYGYHIFENKLSAEICDRLVKYATNQPCKMRAMDEVDLADRLDTTYQLGSPRSVRYDFNAQDLLENEDVQNLLADLSFASIAQEYLEARPVIDVLGMWWHTNFSNKPDKEAAQYFHFDMDRPKWLKFFIYLTDVKITNGPHCFVVGSHKSGGIPADLLRKGYARLSDEEVKTAFKPLDVFEFVAPRGTIIAEDTRGLHKGKHVEEGERLMLQIQFSNSLFGGYYVKSQLNDPMTKELEASVKRCSGLYAAYINTGEYE